MFNTISQTRFSPTSFCHAALGRGKIACGPKNGTTTNQFAAVRRVFAQIVCMSSEPRLLSTSAQLVSALPVACTSVLGFRIASSAMSVLESSAAFESRLQELGLSELLPKFNERGWSTFGRFAFATTYVPHQSDDSKFASDVLAHLLPDAGHRDAPAIRRLFFEAYGMAAADLQRRCSRNVDDDDKPRKLPAPERIARMTALRAKLSGLKLVGELEPSNSLTDKFVAMQETGELRYVPWSELTRRDKEVRGDKKDEGWRTDKSGVLRHYIDNIEDPADVSTDLSMKTALQRRGIAMDLANLLSFHEHEKLIDWIMLEYRRDAIPGYASVSLNQVHRCDTEVFIRLAERTSGNLNRDSDHRPPLDSHIREVMKETRITTLLTQLPKAAGKNDSGTSSKRESSELDRLREEVKRLRASSSDKGKAKGNRNNPKGGGKSARKGTTRLPRELINMPLANSNTKFCFDFNLDGCKLLVDGMNCKNGAHKCIKCGSSEHGQRACSKRG